jgi:hypothetical protein
MAVFAGWSVIREISYAAGEKKQGGHTAGAATSEKPHRFSNAFHYNYSPKNKHQDTRDFAQEHYRMAGMTDKERLLGTLRFEKVDRAPDLEFFAWNQTI